MPVTKVWGVDRMDCFASTAGKTNVVTVVYWRLTGTDGANSAQAYGAVKIAPYVAGQPTAFIEYASLTLAQVLIWAHLALGSEKDTIESGMDAQVAALVTPATVHAELPWAT